MSASRARASDGIVIASLARSSGVTGMGLRRRRRLLVLVEIFGREVEPVGPDNSVQIDTNCRKDLGVPERGNNRTSVGKDEVLEMDFAFRSVRKAHPQPIAGERFRISDPNTF